jgi:hypothetical protein
MGSISFVAVHSKIPCTSPRIRQPQHPISLTIIMPTFPVAVFLLLVAALASGEIVKVRECFRVHCASNKLASTIAHVLTILSSHITFTQDKGEGDVSRELLGAPERTGGRSLQRSHMEVCAQRCVTSCVGKPNPSQCATGFIAGRCKKFTSKSAAVVKRNCLTGIACRGGRRCPDKTCAKPGAC